MRRGAACWAEELVSVNPIHQMKRLPVVYRLNILKGILLIRRAILRY